MIEDAKKYAATQARGSEPIGGYADDSEFDVELDTASAEMHKGKAKGFWQHLSLFNPATGTTGGLFDYRSGQLLRIAQHTSRADAQVVDQHLHTMSNMAVHTTLQHMNTRPTLHRDPTVVRGMDTLVREEAMRGIDPISGRQDLTKATDQLLATLFEDNRIRSKGSLERELVRNKQ